MTPQQATNAAALIGVIVNLGQQIAAATATLQAAHVEGRDVTTEELAAARAAAVSADDTLAKTA